MSCSLPLTPAAEELRQQIRERTGLDFCDVRADLFEAALAREARAAGAESPEAHARALLDGAVPLTPFVEELTVGETWFFREPAQWTFVERVIVPDALVRRVGRADVFRAWSAGCATGEEPYTLAILLHDLGLHDRVHLVATDLNETALARARRAEFSLWSLRGEVGDRARRHLRPAGGHLVLDPAIAALVRFAPLNLALGEYPSVRGGLADLDLVLCRNVLIYLDDAHVEAVVRRMFATLAPGGWLLAGASDPRLDGYAPFTVRSGPFGVAYQRPETVIDALPQAGRRVAPERTAARELRPVAVAAPARGSPPAPTGGAPRGRAPPPETAVAAREATDAGRAPAAAEAPPLPTRPQSEVDPDLAAARSLVDAARLAEALAAVEAALARRPLDPEVHFEKAVVHTELGRLDLAESSCRSALYLARGHPFVHFFMAMLRLRRGDRAGAARAFRNAAALAARSPAGAEVPLSHGMTAGALADAARFHLGRLAGDGPREP